MNRPHQDQHQHRRHLRRNVPLDVVATGLEAHDLLGLETPSQPPSLHPAEMLHQTERRPAHRLDRRAQLLISQPVELAQLLADAFGAPSQRRQVDRLVERQLE